MEDKILETTSIEGALTSDPVIDASNAPLTEAEVEQIILGPDLTEEDRARAYKRLGRPETHEGYDLADIVPTNYNQGLIEDFKKQAYENGMSNEGVRKMAEWYKNVELAQQEAIQKSRQIQADHHLLELRKEFGSKFDQEVNHARKALDAYTDKDFKQYMDDTGLGNHPALVKAFAKIGRELSEDRLVQSDTAARLSRDDSTRRSEILRLRSDPAFMERYRRGDVAAVQRLNRLYIED